jgi:hypothetical protein
MQFILSLPTSPTYLLAMPTSSWAKPAAREGGKPLRHMRHSFLKPPGRHPSFQTILPSFPQYKKVTAPLPCHPDRESDQQSPPLEATHVSFVFPP